jgi:hypothetical protein
MVKDILKAVLTSVLTATIIGTAIGVWNLIMTVHDLRQDVDALYSLVDDVARGK